MENIEFLKKDLILKKEKDGLTWRELGYKLDIQYANLFNFVHGKRTLPERSLQAIKDFVEKK